MPVLGFILLALLPLTVQAYPNFIGYGYNNCLTCHYNPFGNGPLKDYGRAFAATGLADRFVYTKKTTEDDLVSYSGFFAGKPSQEWIRPSMDYRGLILKRNFREDSETTRWIDMQAEGNIVIQMGEKNNFYGSFTYGYAPQPHSRRNDADLENYRSREHYVAWRPDTWLGFYVGLMDKVFGLRVPDHTAFSRALNDMSQNDQSHGALIHMNNESFNLGVQYFIGNLAQEDDLRQIGVTGKFEWTPGPKQNYGVSFLRSASDIVDTTLYALHAKWGIGKGNSIITELGRGEKSSRITAETSTHRYAFLQGHILLRRGLFFYQTVEWLRPSATSTLFLTRFGPGIQWFPFSRLELRADLYNTRTFTDTRVVVDSWDFAGQVHVWF